MFYPIMHHMGLVLQRCGIQAFQEIGHHYDGAGRLGHGYIDQVAD